MSFRRIQVVAAACLVSFSAACLAGDEENSGALPVLDGELAVLDLQECIALALEHNLELEIQRIAVRRAEESITEAEAGFDPRLSGSANYSESASAVAASDLDGAGRPTSSSTNASANISKPLQTGGRVGLSLRALDRLETNSEFALLNPTYNSSFSVDLRQPLLRGRGRELNRAGIHQALLVAEGAKLRLEGRFHSLLAEVERAYWTAAAAELVREVRQGSLDLADLVLEETRARAELDDARRIDVLEAQAAAAGRREALLSSEIDTEAARDELLRVIGILGAPGMEDVRLSQGLPDSSAGGSPDPDHVFAAAMATSPDQRALRSDIVSAEISATTTRNAQLPQLDLSASGGVSGRAGSFDRASNAAFNPDGEFWQFGLDFSTPLGNRAEKARYRSAVAGVEQAKLAEDAGALGLLAQVRNACREHRRAAATLETSQLSVELQEAKLEVQEATREQGAATVREVLEAEQELADAKLRNLQARVALAAAEVEIARLSGALPEALGLQFEPTAAPTVQGEEPRP